MSLECYEIAQERAKEIITLYEYIKTKEEITSEGEVRHNGVIDMCTLSSFAVFYKLDYPERDFRAIVILPRDVKPEVAANTAYDIDQYYINIATVTDYTIEKGSTIRYTLGSEYDEAWGFQLSTRYSDSELVKYYVFCILKEYGFYGYINRRVIDEIVLSVLIKAMNLEKLENSV